MRALIIFKLILFISAISLAEGYIKPEHIEAKHAVEKAFIAKANQQLTSPIRVISFDNTFEGKYLLLQWTEIFVNASLTTQDGQEYHCSTSNVRITNMGSNWIVAPFTDSTILCEKK